MTEEESAAFWDRQADTFDTAPDHGLLEPQVRAAWRDLLLSVLPPAPAVVLDLGCGTGSLSVLLARAGYAVHGMDLSAGMLDVARGKADASGVPLTLVQGDAVSPPYRPGCCDVLLARHLLWVLPDPGAALGRWVDLLRPGGRMVLIEGRWSTGAGLSAADCSALVGRHGQVAPVRQLSDPALWGGPISDERYLVLSRH